MHDLRGIEQQRAQAFAKFRAARLAGCARDVPMLA
jgi:hypothetical protein